MVIPYYCEDYPENPNDFNDAESPISTRPDDAESPNDVPNEKPSEPKR